MLSTAIKGIPHSRHFFMGMRDMIPLVIAATPFAIVFGALGIANGLPAWLLMAMSVCVFAGSSQFIAVTLLATGTAYPIIILTVFIVNLRHLLYAASLMTQLAKVPQLMRFPMAFWLTDETYAIVNHRITQSPEDAGFPAYYIGSALFMYSNWVFFSWIGINMGQSIPNLANWGLDIAMVVAFIGIVVPSLKKHGDWACALSAGVSICFTYSWPNQTGLLFSSLMAIATGMFVDYLQSKEPSND